MFSCSGARMTSRRGDLYQRLAALQDAQRRHLEKMTAHARDAHSPVAERIQLLHYEETEAVRCRKTVKQAYGPQDMAGLTCAEQRLRDTLRQTQRMNITLQAAMEETSAQCECLQQCVRTRAARSSLAATLLTPVSAATATGHPSEVPQSSPCQDASPCHEWAELARHSASFYAKAFSDVREKDIQRQLQNPAAYSDPAAVIVALTALAKASDKLLLSYGRVREEQHAHHLALLRTFDLLFGEPA
ncbi:hypothetical protein CGC21_3510 [Leishmania donovani]|uniref:Uncharacterized protein n=1 Tax=Leishmania donovani TaxID=5661 RepID=A0A504XZI2_LEIDO|nr:hypothetical protein CGC21_3510 [Leishmania donovani]